MEKEYKKSNGRTTEQQKYVNIGLAIDVLKIHFLTTTWQMNTGQLFDSTL